MWLISLCFPLGEEATVGNHLVTQGRDDFQETVDNQWCFCFVRQLSWGRCRSPARPEHFDSRSPSCLLLEDAGDTLPRNHFSFLKWRLAIWILPTKVETRGAALLLVYYGNCNPELNKGSAEPPAQTDPDKSTRASLDKYLKAGTTSSWGYLSIQSAMLISRQWHAAQFTSN